jgi:hypothetical protein
MGELYGSLLLPGVLAGMLLLVVYGSLLLPGKSVVGTAVVCEGS